MADFRSRLCGNPEQTAMSLCGSKTTFAIHAIIPMTMFDFLPRCFLENPSLDWRRINKMSHPEPDAVLVLCQSVPLTCRCAFSSPAGEDWGEGKCA